MKNAKLQTKKTTQTNVEVTEVPKTLKAPKKPKGRIVYTNISTQTGINILESHIGFKLPEGGIHKPCLWKSRDGWGAMYRVFAAVPLNKITGPKFTKHLLIQLKWRGMRELLLPAKGQEDLLKTIDIKPARYLKELMPANVNQLTEEK